MGGPRPMTIVPETVVALKAVISAINGRMPTTAKTTIMSRPASKCLGSKVACQRQVVTKVACQRGEWHWPSASLKSGLLWQGLPASTGSAICLIPAGSYNSLELQKELCHDYQRNQEKGYRHACNNQDFGILAHDHKPASNSQDNKPTSTIQLTLHIIMGFCAPGGSGLWWAGHAPLNEACALRSKELGSRCESRVQRG